MTAERSTPPHPPDRRAGLDRLGLVLDAVLVDLGGTIVAEAPPGTAVADLRVTILRDGLAALRAVRAAGVPTAAVTNTAVMVEADVRSLLGPSGLDAQLDVVVTSVDVGVAKPDPAAVVEALRRLGGVAPHRALLIGDADADTGAAAAAGVHHLDIRDDDRPLLTAITEWLATQAPPTRPQ